MFVHQKEFELYGCIIQENDIQEVDSLEELKTLDPSYK